MNNVVCYQKQLIPSHGGLIGISSALMNAKICFGVLMVTMYAIYMGSSFFFLSLHSSKPSDEEQTGVKYLFYLGVAFVLVAGEEVRNWAARVIEICRKKKGRVVEIGKETVGKSEEMMEKRRSKREEKEKEKWARAMKQTIIHVLPPAVEEAPMVLPKEEWWRRYP
jgi:hypothetical protein